MNPKISREHQERGAVVYVRQSTMMQVTEHLESQRRQYALADQARIMGFSAVETIDDDLGRSGSGLVDRPGFQRLVARVCAGSVGAVLSIEASRLARNGRDWHHLIDLCALVGTLVIDPDGVYDPRLLNDRLLLGLKGTMSEYELSLLRQRGLAARDAKASRGELRIGLPPGFCWDELNRVSLDPDERVTEAIRMVFRKFREFGSARQVLLWIRAAGVKMPVTRSGLSGTHIEWHNPAYHNILLVLTNPTYAGAYVFGRTENHICVSDGRARKTTGHKKPRERWSVLIPDHHPGYITWDDFEQNLRIISDNAHMQNRSMRKAGRGGRALLTGLLRCGSCGRMLHVLYGTRSAPVHRYHCTGDLTRSSARCISIGGVHADRTISAEILKVLTPHSIKAALQAAARSAKVEEDARKALMFELEEARYEAELAARRHSAVDPDKRLVARELESRWEAALARIRTLEDRQKELDKSIASRCDASHAQLDRLAKDLVSIWNAPSSAMHIKQRIVRILVQEIVVAVDHSAGEVILTVHWAGGRHSEVRIARRRKKPRSSGDTPSAVEIIRTLGSHFDDRELAVTMNRMRCADDPDSSWTIARVRELRERLGIDAFHAKSDGLDTISADEAAERLGISISSLHRLIREKILPASQAMHSAPWQIPVAALHTEVVRIGVQEIVSRRPHNYKKLQDLKNLRLPGI